LEKTIALRKKFGEHKSKKEKGRKSTIIGKGSSFSNRNHAGRAGGPAKGKGDSGELS